MKQIILITLGIIIIFLTITLMYNSYNNKETAKKEKQRYENNIDALNDSIRDYKNKVGENSFEKLITVMTKEELKIYNKELYDNIVKEDGKVKTIIKTKIEYVDSGKTITIIQQLDSNLYSANFKYTSKDSVLFIKGRTRFHADIINNSICMRPELTFIDEAKTIIGLTLGTKENNGKIEAFVTPESENVKISKLNGSEIYVPVKKKQRFSINASLGYGASVTGSKVYICPSFNIGIGYNLISF